MTPATFPAVRGDVLLVGGYGAGNLGDEAILAGLLRSVPDEVRRLSVVTRDPPETRRRAADLTADVPLRPVPATVPALAGALRSEDAFVVGGGGIFSRYVGPAARKIPYYALAVHALGKPVHWTAVGVYRSTPARVRPALFAALERAASVSVRDPASQRFLDAHGVSDVRLVEDPAMRLTPDRAAGRRHLAEAGFDPDAPLLGVAARRVLDVDRDADLQVAYRSVADAFDRRGWQLAFLPFCRHPTARVEQDQRVCTPLAARYGGRVLTVTDPQALMGVVAHCDALVATRLHSMLFALRADVPFAAVTYAEKVESLLEAYGVADRGVPLDAVGDGRLLASLERAVDAAEGRAVR
ncbi:MAG: polysaccharide pyruvyl transferase family protein [Halobacteriaceae archaeon]